MEFADLFVAIVSLGFLAVATAYVRWCDRIVGADPLTEPAGPVSSVWTPEAVEAR